MAKILFKNTALLFIFSSNLSLEYSSRNSLCNSECYFMKLCTVFIGHNKMKEKNKLSNIDIKTKLVLLLSLALSLPLHCDAERIPCEELPKAPIVELAGSDSVMQVEANMSIGEIAENPDTTFQAYGHKTEVPTIYDYKYSKSFSCPNKKRLIKNTIALYVAGVATLGVLEMLPENTTAWNKEELRKTPFFKRWWMHVKKGPVWDRDNWVFNYVLHPYGGAAYYMSARSQGLNTWQSALYSFGVSTIFWEYGIEAFMEYPSIQDLIITPVVGSLIGEQFYKIKRHIVDNDYNLLGSSYLGHIVAFLVDPVNEFMGLFLGNPCHKRNSKKGISFSSMVSHNSINLNITF